MAYSRLDDHFRPALAGGRSGQVRWLILDLLIILDQSQVAHGLGKGTGQEAHGPGGGSGAS